MKTTIKIVHFAVLLFTAFSFTQASATDLDQTKNSMAQTADLFSRIIEKAKPAVVYIQVKKENKQKNSSKSTSNSFYSDEVIDNFFGDKSTGKKSRSFFTDTTSYGIGSGFIFNSDGYILTNSHVIKDATEISVTLSDKRKVTARIIGIDPQTDIGLIKIKGKNLPSVPLGSSEHLKCGEWVLAIGSPYEFLQTVTAGIISATGRNSLGISDYESFIQTDAAINPGNSGGPLINIHGKVIGINTAFLTQTGGYMGIGFAVPISMARKVVEQLIRDGKVTRAWLGVGLKDATASQLKTAKPAPVQAAWIVGVRDDSPAKRAGLQKGDMITAINGNPLTGAADLRNRVSLTAPSSEVTLEYYRDKNKFETSVTLGVLP